MKQIPLTQGKFALVDDKDYNSLKCFKWRADKGRYCYYAVRSIQAPDFKRLIIRMHRVILKPLNHLEVDHINCNGLDNQRSNLRSCSCTENNRHKRISRLNTSGFKGVSLIKDAQRRPFRAIIRLNKKQIHLGNYSTAEIAAKVYDLAAIKYFGKFALTNRMLGLVK